MFKKNLILLLAIITSLNLNAAEDSIYNFNWLDDDEKVYVIQNKEYPTNERVELNLSFTDSDNSPYQTTLGWTFGLTYYFNEVFSVDVMYRDYFNSNTADLDNLLSGTIDKKPLVRNIEYASLFHFNWLPFYGKINTLNKIFYFYAGVGVGLGQFKTLSNYATLTDSSKGIVYSKKEEIFGGSTKLFVKFFLAKNWNFGIDMEIMGFNAIVNSNLTEGLVIYNDTTFTFGYLF